jgi:membrane protein
MPVASVGFSTIVNTRPVIFGGGGSMISIGLPAGNLPSVSVTKEANPSGFPPAMAMTAVITTLNRVYDIEDFRPWWKTRLIAIGLSVTLAVFAVIAFGLVVGGSDLAGASASWLGAGDLFQRAWTVAQWPVAFLCVVFAIDVVYYLAPNADTEWVWITPGSIVATALWLITSLGFKWYLQYVSNIAAVQGAIGSVIVLLLWLYLSGFAILIGAELNAEIDRAMPTRDDAPQTPARRKKIGPAQRRRPADDAPSV